MHVEVLLRRWMALLLYAALLTTGCAAVRPPDQRAVLRDAAGGASPRGGAPRFFHVGSSTWAGGAVQPDVFEQLLLSAGLERQDEWPVAGSALTPKQSSRLLAALLRKPVTLANFPPRLGASCLLREVLQGGEVSREELLRRVKRFNRAAVLRPDGYLAWVLSGRTQQKVAPVEWRGGAFRALGFELGRFYLSNGYVFRPADERLQPVSDSLQVEVYDDADVVSRTLDGAQDAFVELAFAIGKLLTYPSDSLAALQNLPAGVAALIASSPEYLERFQNMTRGEQVKVLSQLTTTLIVTWGTAGGTSGTLTATLGGAEATVPVLTLSAEGTLVLEHVVVPVGTVATSVGAGVGGVYVLATGSNGGSRAGKDFTPGGRRQIDAENAAKNGGVNKCENCGTSVVPGQKSQRGVSPPANQRERDHVIPKSQGGDGTPSNGQILCRGCNLEKSDTGP